MSFNTTCYLYMLSAMHEVFSALILLVTNWDMESPMYMDEVV